MEITTRQQLRSDLSDETKPQLDSSVSLPLIEAAYLHTYLYVAGGLGSGNHWCERQTNLEGTTKPKMNPMKQLKWTIISDNSAPNIFIFIALGTNHLNFRKPKQ